MKRTKWERGYSEILRKEDKEGILLLDRPIEHTCRCGVVFMGTRNAVWCAACKPLAEARTIARSQAKARAQRAAARAKRGAA